MNKYQYFKWVFLISFVFAISFISAELPNMRVPDGRVIQTTVYTNVSLNISATHNDLAGLQGGTATERYHLNNSIYSYLLSNIYSFLTSFTETDPIFTSANTSLARTGNCPAGQVVQNTTTNGVQCVPGADGSTYNATYDATSQDVAANRSAWFSTYNATYAAYAYNQTIPANAYTDSQVNKTFNQSLTDNLYYPLNTNPKNYLNSTNFTGQNVTANWFFGLFNWVLNLPGKYLTGSFNGSTLVLQVNETALNATIDNRIAITPVSTYNATYDATSKDVAANRSAWFSTYNATYDTYAYNQTAPAIAYANANFYNKSANINTGVYNITTPKLNATRVYSNITHIGNACLYWNGTAMIGENPCTQ